MSRIKDLFQEQQNVQALAGDEELSWVEAWEEYWLATHFDTKYFKNGKWQEITLDLRDFEVLIPHKSPALCYLINCKSRILIQSPFKEVQYLWKKVQSNPSNH